MSFEGVVQNGVVVLQGGEILPEGTFVRVEPIPAKITQSSAGERPTLEWLLAFAGTANDLPADMALNHDHYLHGAPKR